MDDREAMFEEEIADRTGVSRAALRDLRVKEMEKGRDWRMHKNRVVLLPSGIEAINRRLPLAPGGLGVDMENPPEPPPRVATEAEGTKTGRVVRLFGVNIQLMEVELDESGEKIRVRVRNNRMFVIGQRVPVQRDGDAWFLGCRQPVMRGRLRW